MTQTERTTGRVFTAEERVFCVKVGLEIGFDIDDDQPQHAHVCWPYSLWWGALCKTSRLWFQHPTDGTSLRGDDSIVEEMFDCEECLCELALLMKTDDRLLRGIGRLAATVRAQRAICNAAEEFLWSLDHPEKYAELQSELSRPNSARAKLDEAMACEAARWKALVEEDK